MIDWIRQRERTRGGRWTRLGIGDDCAILGVDPGTELLVTTDMLMDGRHFRLAEDGPRAVGYKALGVNLSDIAAMAGVPRAAVDRDRACRDRMRPPWRRGVYLGMRELAERFGVDLVGGDTNAWDGPLVISVTVLGEATARGAVRRSGARPGDAILVTGPLGGSLFAGRHLRPEPRVAEALAVHQIVPIHALIDISDGLSSDLGHILNESGGLGAVLDEPAIPIHPDAHDASQRDGTSALEHALNDGEDFELCLVVSADDAARLLAAPLLRPGFTASARLLTSQACFCALTSGLSRPITPAGFDHLS